MASSATRPPVRVTRPSGQSSTLDSQVRVRRGRWEDMADKSDLLRPVDIATRIGDVLFTVGQVCTIAGITKMQLDLWTERAAIETLGAKQRLYDVDAVEHVMLIAQARGLGFSVDAAIDAASLFRSRHGLDQRRIAA